MIHPGIKEYVGKETDFLRKRTKAIHCYKGLTNKLAKWCDDFKDTSIYNKKFTAIDTLEYLEKIIF